jgi:hypothetical protein
MPVVAAVHYDEQPSEEKSVKGLIKLGLPLNASLLAMAGPKVAPDKK